MIFSPTYNASVDIWSLGVFIHHILLGRTPFKAGTLDEVRGHFETGFETGAPEDVSRLSPECRDLIEHLLDRDPRRRIGCRSSTLEDVKSHPFFHSIDWDGLFDPSHRKQRSLFGDQESGALAPADVGSDAHALRNFNVNEWRDVQLSTQEDDPCGKDDALWPLQTISKRKFEEHHIVGFSFSARSKAHSSASLSYVSG
eukprot:Plantae.Rhodophyta-Rhodochaete_pulchella.ctg4063.p2 GENE.Plantae.Rhodophyta-Rhodochaete_pulchella.ctg4063~~Plantae.Rhodophyta-Rhodochaete_pulchella.ctg4063.p2  ORF type:complete len:199 (-),score=28.86 Plantae.Rhodophyta-Rhodochaete_pulchella.ctg4063:106-702(-)